MTGDVARESAAGMQHRQGERHALRRSPLRGHARPGARSAQAAPSRRIASTAGQIGAAGLAVKDERRQQAEPARLPLTRADEDAVRGVARARMDGQDVDAAEAAAERGEQRVAGRRRGRSRRARRRGFSTDAAARNHGSRPPSPSTWARGARRRTGGLRARRRIVERRVDDDRVGERATEAGRGALGFRRGDVGGDDPDRGRRRRDWPDGASAARGAGDGVGVALDEHDLRAGAARGDAHAGDADPGAEVDDRAGEAGIEGRGEQHRLEAGAMMAGAPAARPRRGRRGRRRRVGAPRRAGSVIAGLFGCSSSRRCRRREELAGVVELGRRRPGRGAAGCRASPR